MRSALLLSLCAVPMMLAPEPDAGSGAAPAPTPPQTMEDRLRAVDVEAQKQPGWAQRVAVYAVPFAEKLTPDDPELPELLDRAMRKKVDAGDLNKLIALFNKIERYYTANGIDISHGGPKRQ